MQHKAFHQAEASIDRFIVLYPDSERRPELQLIKARFLRERGDYEAAILQIRSLNNESPSNFLRAEIILEQAILFYNLDQLNEAELALQRLISEFSTPYINQQYHYWRGMINLRNEQPYSALHSLQQAANLGLVDEELDHHLFQLYLLLDKEDVARNILNSYRSEWLSDALLMYVDWLSYLQNKGRFAELDMELAQLELEIENLPRPIQSILIRSQLIRNQFRLAGESLAKTEIHGDEFIYYYSTLLHVSGELLKADSLLSELEKSDDPEIALLSKLERMKIHYRRDPAQTILTLTAMLDQPMSSRLKGNIYLLLATFHYHDQDFSKAISNLLNARKHEVEPNKLDLIDSLIPEIWFTLQSYRNATVTFNRYLNVHPHGAYRDKALYMLAVLSYLEKDYQSFWAYYNRFMEDHSGSIYADQARFYAADVDFNLANYSRSLPILQDLHIRYPADRDIIMRLAQTHFYLGDYLEAKVLVNAIPDHATCYDATILNASIYFNEKDYMRSLEFYRRATDLAPSEVKRIEALSYQALALFQLRRFKDASDLYYQIAKVQGTPETYLYMAAKSAAHARNFHQALMIYDSFLSQYPNSKNFIRVLNDVAKVYFNMGNYDGAIQTWNNVLRRYISKKGFTEEELTLLREVFAGLDYSFRLSPSEQYIDELLTMIDAFSSEYIQFELQYLLIKLYAESQQWQSLLRQADDLRRLFPDRYIKEIEILTAESLIQLHDYARADSIFAEILRRDGMSEILYEWVDLDLLTGQYASALQKLSTAFDESPDQQIWLTMLDIAYQFDLTKFDAIWRLPGVEEFKNHPEALKLEMLYLFESDQFDAAETVAERLIGLRADAQYDAYASLVKAIVLYTRELYSEALTLFNRILVLYPDKEDITREAIFYVILCQFAANNALEARMIFQTNLGRLTIDQVRYLEPLLMPTEGIDEN